MIYIYIVYKRRKHFFNAQASSYFLKKEEKKKNKQTNIAPANNFMLISHSLI